MTVSEKYGPDLMHNVEITPAPAGKTQPSVIWIHGGGWHVGDNTATGTAKKCGMLAARGFTTFNIDYRLTTATRRGVGVQTEDVRLAIRWVKANAAKWGGSTTDVSMVGGSAGGHLASLTSMTEPVSRVVAVSAPVDLTVIEGVPVGTYRQIEAYLGGTKDTLSEQAVKDSSPLYAISATCPPHLICNSTNELIPLSQAQAMDAALRARGVRSQLLVAQGRQHAMSLYDDFETEIVSFLRS